MAEKEFDQLTPEEKKARFQKAFDDYNSGFVEVDYALRSVASIRVEEALEDAVGSGVRSAPHLCRHVRVPLSAGSFVVFPEGAIPHHGAGVELNGGPTQFGRGLPAGTAR